MAENANPTIRVDKAVCRKVTKHIPDEDVAYQPGVDVHGKAVVPADVAPQTDYHIEDNFNMRLTLDAAKAFGLKVPNIPSAASGANPNVPAVMSDTVAGYITLKHGKAYLNNRPMDDAQQNQLAILCKEQQPE
jgi:hypothetical protein